MCIPRPRRHRAASSSSSAPIRNLPYHRIPSPPPTPRMVPKPTSPLVGGGVSGGTSAAFLPAPPRVSSQHERLLLELLPFNDSAKFHEWLDGNFVRGSWIEFYTDYLSKAASAAGGGRAGGAGLSAVPEPDKTRTAQAARNAINSRTPKFLVYHPDKAGWTAEDHHVRFIVTLVADNMLQNLWHESEWKKKGLDVAKAAYEVLIFLKATAVYVDPNPPGYSA
ncbi:hypothetical protein EsH8_IX_000552 [Colletotrichum jinshuiense]